MTRLHRDVMRLLTDEIVTGRRRPGEMLPREIDLAAQFNVSRGVARETIRAMEERGLVSVRHGKGATVNDGEHWDIFDPDVLVAVLGTERGGDVLSQYVECRRILEVEAAGLAAERAGPRLLEPLSAALARMEEAVAEPPTELAERRFHEADIAFHQALMRATGNLAVASLIQRIHSALLVARYPLARPEYRELRAMPEHRRIYDAVAAGDREGARAAMNAHLDTVAAYLDEHRRARRNGRRAPRAG